jgi:hypothetical protein
VDPPLVILPGIGNCIGSHAGEQQVGELNTCALLRWTALGMTVLSVDIRLWTGRCAAGPKVLLPCLEFAAFEVF